MPARKPLYPFVRTNTNPRFQPPIVPKVSYDGDTRNFDDYPESNWQKAPAASEKDMRHFLDF